MGVVGTLAVRLMSKAIAGDKPSGFARALVGLAHEARQNATSTGKMTRLRVTANTATAEQFEAATNSWSQVGAVVSSTEVNVCLPMAGAQLTAATPVCPLSAGTHVVCFAPNGNASVTTTGACPAANPRGGGTLFLQGVHNTKDKYKVVVWGLTGLPKLVTAW